MSHSKKNSTRAFFTANERAELKGQWGSTSTRLTRESFLPFGSCNLCLIPARDAVACPDEGHLFCRECVISNLLAQTKEIKRLNKAAKRKAVEDAEEREIKLAETHDQELNAFESVQAGFSPLNDQLISVKRPRTHDYDDPGAKRRKSQDNTGSKDTAFWIPSSIADMKPEATKAAKKHPECPATSLKNSHELSLKTLIDVKFVMQDVNGAQDKLLICPSCDKTLSNSTKAILAKTCGHVLCKSCSEKFQASDRDQEARCFSCAIRLISSERDETRRGLIMLKSDATGFAGAGNNTVKREGLAFQFG